MKKQDRKFYETSSINLFDAVALKTLVPRLVEIIRSSAGDSTWTGERQSLSPRF